ncbi:hypothetical protein RND81_11G206500 [Saponaria officinalis]|uniref:Uncharacterized protein n=1 Tax=Saponaria officinalis TaxID=3572 RepID=A0AAW1HPL5_SAPOF
MDKEQQKEWAEAQKIAVSFDLVEAAKKHLLFLAAVDRNRHLYEDHVLQRAIYRYNAYWLPLLAKHLKNPVSEDPLVVPLDCEWIWHCHRLNPIRYKFDCEKLYGRILGYHNVVSSIQASSKSKIEEIWNKMYPEEPYELDINRPFSEDVMQNGPQNEKFTSYDLLAAVKRQIPFTFQISRPHMSDDLFLREAEARYKGFLHLARVNMKKNVQQFCVPTYDVDLMWHTHQLYPSYYCKDLINIVGKVLQHDDTDSDRSKGNKLDTGFTETSKQFEETFGKRYWKAGAMYRGNAPAPVTDVPSKFRIEGKKSNAIENCGNLIQLSERKAVEVFLEFVDIKNLPENHKDNLVVSFSKKQPDMLFNIKRSLTIFSESGEKQMAYFHCEPTGEFLFELKSESSSNKLIPKSSKVLGTCSLSLQELVSSRSQLSADKWLSVDPVPSLEISEPILLHVSVSFTPPTPAPRVFHLEQSQDSLRFLKIGKGNNPKNQTYVTDDVGNVVFSLQMRNTIKDATKSTPDLLKEVYYITDSGEKHKVAEALGNKWVIKGIHGSLTLQNKSGNNDHLFELVGDKMVKLFSGRTLDFEPKHCGSRSEKEFITAVEFSADYPYGRATALYDLKLGTIKALDEWIVLPGIILGFILTGGIVHAEVLKDESDGVNACVNERNAGCLPPCAGEDAKIGDYMQAKVMMNDIDEMNACVNEGNGGGFGKCSTPCAPCVMEEVNNDGMVKSGSCGGGGKCGGGKCSGGKCGGSMDKSGGGSCDAACGAACFGECDGIMKMSGGGCSGGGCNGVCGGKCGFPDMNGGGKCSGKCSGGKCGGSMDKSGGSCSAGCSATCGSECAGIMKMSGGGRSCGSKCVEDVGGNDMPTVVSSIMNEPAAA